MSPPSRLVVLGGRGFLGAEIGKFGKQAGWRTLLLGSFDVDLETRNAGAELALFLEPGDAVIYAAAVAPARVPADITRNITMAMAVVSAVREAQVAQLVVISSDGIYGSQSALRSEQAPAEPDTIHGVMHLAREITCQTAEVPLISIIRPSAIYGVDDPHNAYGPNRFARAAVKKQKVPLLGEGASVRDHVAVTDVAELTCSVVRSGLSGTFNAVSGHSTSFIEVAEIIASVLPRPCEIASVGPESPPTFQYYDTSRVKEVFPNLKPMKPELGLVQLVEALARRGQDG
jgi:nucleoside-diphosphate-sugar epimerase